MSFLKRMACLRGPNDIRHIPTRADTLQQWLNQLTNNARISEWNRREKAFEVETWRLIRKFERPWFTNKFEKTLWAYLGTESLMPVDYNLYT